MAPPGLDEEEASFLNDAISAVEQAERVRREQEDLDRISFVVFIVDHANDWREYLVFSYS